MRSFAAVAIFCIGLGLALSAGLGAGNGASRAASLDGLGRASPKPLPALAFVDGEGRAVNLKDFAGRHILLNLWATWCGPCVREMPSLDRLQGMLGGPKFQVVALSLDRGGRATVVPFMARHDLQRLGLYLDPAGAAMAALGVEGLPTTLLIDPQGREIGRVEGSAAWDGAAVVTVLKGLIEGAPAAAPNGMPGVVKTGG